MYKEDLALNNLQWLICHKAKPKHTKRFISLEKSVQCCISLKKNYIENKLAIIFY